MHLREFGKKLTWSADMMRGLGFHCFLLLAKPPTPVYVYWPV